MQPSRSSSAWAASRRCRLQATSADSPKWAGSFGGDQVSVIITPTSGTTNSLTLTFANVNNAGVDFGSLADGRWQLSVVPAGYTSPNAPTDTALRRLFGDSDNNGTVDATDFSFFPPFGATVASPFDFNNNNDVDASDFAEFGGRVGYTVA